MWVSRNVESLDDTGISFRSWLWVFQRSILSVLFPYTSVMCKEVLQIDRYTSVCTACCSIIYRFFIDFIRYYYPSKTMLNYILHLNSCTLILLLSVPCCLHCWCHCCCILWKSKWNILYVCTQWFCLYVEYVGGFIRG